MTVANALDVWWTHEGETAMFGFSDSDVVALARPRRYSAFHRFAHLYPPGKFGRFVVVGIWNTCFGYGSYAALTALLTPLSPYGYLAASVLSHILSLTVAFLGYKWIVFRTHGNYIIEWVRCMGVYGSSIIIGLAILPILVGAVRHVTSYQQGAPYIAGALITCFNATISFFGHSQFSFRRAS